MTAPSALYLAHCAADHQFAASDTHDILPGIDPAQAIETARRIIASPYHDDCPTCHPSRCARSPFRVDRPDRLDAPA